MQRWLEKSIQKDLKEKIVLLAGPRQVGKTTVSKSLFSKADYLNFDSEEDRKIISKKLWNRAAPLVIFDELHKMKRWKSWIKGIYDKEGVSPALLVTGSARMDTYKKGGDSLAGRHFSYRLYPFTVKELKDKFKTKESLDRILKLGGFPEPFLKNSELEAKRWRKSHLDVILREDLLDLEKVRDIKSIELLIDLLRNRVGSTISYSSLASDLQVSAHTVKHWLQILENLYVIFPVRSYHHNVARSILKDTKYYFFDTGQVNGNEGQRLENTVACALLTELHQREDTLGVKTSLHFLRDKEKREIDFLTVIDKRPTCLIEVKWDDQNISKNFKTFLNYLGNLPAYQLVYELKRPLTSPQVKLVTAEDFLLNFDLD